MQKIIVAGYVGKDPELSSLPDGRDVARFSIATSERWKDKNTGEQKEHTEWFNCSAFGKLATLFKDYVNKGSYVTVIAKKRERKYTKDGVERYATDFIVDEVFFGPKTGDNSIRAPREDRKSSAPAQGEDFDDDIPF
jgi:single-strand DNA-binding protein